jgi:hypothetical protein
MDPGLTLPDVSPLSSIIGNANMSVAKIIEISSDSQTRI